MKRRSRMSWKITATPLTMVSSRSCRRWASLPLRSYKGAQIFEAFEPHSGVVDKCFNGTASRVQGTAFDLFAMDVFELYGRGWPSRETITLPGILESGEHHWRDGGRRIQTIKPVPSISAVSSSSGTRMQAR